MQDPAPDLTNDFFSFFGEKHQFFSLPNKAETGYYGTYTKNKTGLQRDNEAGKDIYFTVNEAKPGIQRTKDKFVRARAVYIDDDGDNKHGGATGGFPIPPNITVYTSPGKAHYYWFTSTTDGDAFEAVLRGMAAEYNGDPATLHAEKLSGFPQKRVGRRYGRHTGYPGFRQRQRMPLGFARHHKYIGGHECVTGVRYGSGKHDTTRA